MSSEDAINKLREMAGNPDLSIKLRDLIETMCRKMVQINLGIMEELTNKIPYIKKDGYNKDILMTTLIMRTSDMILGYAFARMTEECKDQETLDTIRDAWSRMAEGIESGWIDRGFK